MFRKDESGKRSNPYTSRVDFYCFLDSLVDEMEKYNWIDEMFAEVEREGTQDLEKVLG